MHMGKSTTAGKAKPAKPHPDYPLFPHATRRWAKKVRGKLHYFGPWDAPEAALNLWLDQKDDLLAGRTPRAKADGLTVRDLANRFLTAKRHLLDTHELSHRTFEDYHATCERLINSFGKNRLVVDLGADDFDSLRASLGKTWGPVSVANEVNRIRVVFKFAFDADLVDRPVRYGPHFKRPSRKVLRLARAEKGLRLFEVDELRAIIDAAGMPLKAMILLGINCGLGNSDCARLRLRNLDLKGGWLDFPRPKTAIDRRCPLWPETIKAVMEAIAKRSAPKDEADRELVFLTKFGRPWHPIAKRDSPITKELVKLLTELGLKRPGLGFYALRHTVETIGSEARDQVALNHIMGHAPAASDMASVYRERISDERLKAVSDHIHAWLFPPKQAKPRRKAK
jgi:integrase